MLPPSGFRGRRPPGSGRPRSAGRPSGLPLERPGRGHRWRGTVRVGQLFYRGDGRRKGRRVGIPGRGCTPRPACVDETRAGLLTRSGPVGLKDRLGLPWAVRSLSFCPPVLMSCQKVIFPTPLGVINKLPSGGRRAAAKESPAAARGRLPNEPDMRRDKICKPAGGVNTSRAACRANSNITEGWQS